MALQKHKIGVDIEMCPSIADAIIKERTLIRQNIMEMEKRLGEIEKLSSDIATVGERAHNAMLDPNGEQELEEARNAGYAIKEKLRLIDARLVESALSRKHTDTWVRYKPDAR